MKRVFDLDALTGLRGVMSFMVVFGHFNFLFLDHSYNFLAVEFSMPITGFLVISGLTLTVLHFEEPQKDIGSSSGGWRHGAKTWHPFYVRRVARLLPMYYIAQVSGLGYFLIEDSSRFDLMQSHVGEFGGALVMAQPVFLVGMGPNNPTYTLSLVFICYLLLPYMIAHLFGRSRLYHRFAFLACPIIPLAFHGISTLAARSVDLSSMVRLVSHSTIYFRIWHYAMGVVIASYFVGEDGQRSRNDPPHVKEPSTSSDVSKKAYRFHTCDAGSIIGVIINFALIAYGLFFEDHTDKVEHVICLQIDVEFLLAGAMALWVALIARSPCSYTSRILHSTLLQSLGKVSHGVYLFHWPVMIYYSWLVNRAAAASPMFEFIPGPSSPGLLVGPLHFVPMYTILVIVATLADRWIETPMRAYLLKRFL